MTSRPEYVRCASMDTWDGKDPPKPTNRTWCGRTKPRIAVYCIHGPWGLTDARVAAARRLGVKVKTCGFCGKTYQSLVDWSTDSDDLRFCGQRCRERFRTLSHP